MRETSDIFRTWCEAVVASWRHRRGDDGGVTDDTAMIGIMAAAAVVVGGAIYALVTGAVGRIDLGF